MCALGVECGAHVTDTVAPSRPGAPASSDGSDPLCICRTASDNVYWASIRRTPIWSLARYKERAERPRHPRPRARVGSQAGLLEEEQEVGTCSTLFLRCTLPANLCMPRCIVCISGRGQAGGPRRRASRGEQVDGEDAADEDRRDLVHRRSVKVHLGEARSARHDGRLSVGRKLELPGWGGARAAQGTP